jgi:ABC-2 type transport system ATP-binding protein
MGLTGVLVGGAAVTAELGDVAAEDVTGALVRAGVAVRGLAVSRPSLEDTFVALTGEGFDVAR